MDSVPRTLLSCNRLNKIYTTRAGPVTPLENVSVTIAAHEFVWPSGCGKSTLLRLIAGLEAPTSGQIAFATAQPAGRQYTAMSFQEHGLFPWLTVLENMAFGLEMQGVGKKKRFYNNKRAKPAVSTPAANGMNSPFSETRFI